MLERQIVMMGWTATSFILVGSLFPLCVISWGGLTLELQEIAILKAVLLVVMPPMLSGSTLMFSLLFFLLRLAYRYRY